MFFLEALAQYLATGTEAHGDHFGKPEMVWVPNGPFPAPRGADGRSGRWEETGRILGFSVKRALCQFQARHEKNDPELTLRADPRRYPLAWAPNLVDARPGREAWAWDSNRFSQWSDGKWHTDRPVRPVPRRR